MTVLQAASQLRVTPRMIRRMIEAGVLSAELLGDGRWEINAYTVDCHEMATRAARRSAGEAQEGTHEIVG